MVAGAFAWIVFAFVALPFAPQLHAGDAVPPVALIDQDARPFDLGALRGRAVVLSFVYTRCTDSCALTAAKLARVAQSGDLHRVAVVALTVDPQYDRPARLARYRALFVAPARWTLATGDPAALRLFERRLGVEPETRDGGRTDHQDVVVVLDAAGRIVRFVPGDAWTPAQMSELAISASGGTRDPLAALALVWNDSVVSCGRGIAALGSGTSLLVACVLTIALGLPLVRAVLRHRTSERDSF